MKPLTAANAAILVCLVHFYGCNLDGSQISAPDPTSSPDGKTLVYSANQSFSFELELNADAGFMWDCSIADTNVVLLDSTAYRPKNPTPGIEGGITIERFYFRTKRHGESLVRLDEIRGWLETYEPINTVRFTVRVLGN